jgi:hypothetical protein
MDSEYGLKSTTIMIASGAAGGSQSDGKCYSVKEWGIDGVGLEFFWQCDLDDGHKGMHRFTVETKDSRNEFFWKRDRKNR